jgi:hypothetical protein
MTLRRWIKRIATPFVVVIAIIYFLIDALVLSLLRPALEQLGRLRPFAGLRAWIETLGPYPTLALFLVPIILFEPVKPVGLYLLGTGQFVAGTLVLVIGEILKIAIVERLFHVAKPKLMTIRVFAAAYIYIVGWLDWLQALPPWQAVLRWVHAVKAVGREIAAGTWRHAVAMWRRLVVLARGA